MDLDKVILYYAFTPIPDPTALMLWQKNLCETLNLKGRIIISEQGINGTLGGKMSALKKYVKATKEYPGFKKIDFKWSNGTGNDFPKLKIKVKDELVSFGKTDEIKVGEKGIIGGGTHLRPEQVNKLVAERSEDVVFFDGRNSFEAKIGRFKDAVIPNTSTTKDFINELESGKYDHLKNKAVITYCTGGIRCEILSVLMKNRGFQEVYQIKGGVIRYGAKFGDDYLWEGSLFSFDDRLTLEFSNRPKLLGNCARCEAKTKSFRNCLNDHCHQLVLLCDPCYASHKGSPCKHDREFKSKRALVN